MTQSDWTKWTGSNWSLITNFPLCSLIGQLLLNRNVPADQSGGSRGWSRESQFSHWSTRHHFLSASRPSYVTWETGDQTVHGYHGDRRQCYTVHTVTMVTLTPWTVNSALKVILFKTQRNGSSYWLSSCSLIQLNPWILESQPGAPGLRRYWVFGLWHMTLCYLITWTCVLCHSVLWEVHAGRPSEEGGGLLVDTLQHSRVSFTK